MSFTKTKSLSSRMTLPRYTEVLINNHSDFANRTKGVVLGSSTFKDRPHYCVYLYKEGQSFTIMNEFLVPTGITKTAENYDVPPDEVKNVNPIIRELELS